LATPSYEKSWCGSNFDELEQPRFINSDIPYGFDRMMSGTFVEGLNFGYTTFDNIAAAFVTIFQSVTMEGWVDVMYQVMDGYNGFITAVIFALLILLGSNLVLNLVLAVITSAIDDADDEAEAEEAEAEAQEEVAVKEDEPEEEDLSHIPPHRLPVYKLVQGRPFAYLIMAGIFANTVVLSWTATR
jgi:hypothetical protein